MGGVKWILILGFIGGLACLFYVVLKLVLRRSFSMKSRCLCLAGILALFVIPVGALLPPLISIPAVDTSRFETPKNPAGGTAGDLDAKKAGAENVELVQTAGAEQPNIQGVVPGGRNADSGIRLVTWNSVFCLWASVFASLFMIKLIRYCRFYRMCRENGGYGRGGRQRAGRNDGYCI